MAGVVRSVCICNLRHRVVDVDVTRRNPPAAQQKVSDIMAVDKSLYLVEITPDNRNQLVRIALSMCAGEPCRICGEPVTMADMEDGAVFAGYSNDKTTSSAHRVCWQRSPMVDGKPGEDWAHP